MEDGLYLHDLTHHQESKLQLGGPRPVDWVEWELACLPGHI